MKKKRYYTEFLASTLEGQMEELLTVCEKPSIRVESTRTRGV